MKEYQGWTTEQLINNAYERISTLQKLNLNAASVDIRSRLQYLFKYLMLVTAHIEGRTLVLRQGRPR